MKALIALFGRSPFKPIQAHMEKSRACVERIKPLINSIIDGETEKFDTLFKEISDLESEADVIKNDIRSHLPKSIFLPIDRRDLLEILDIQEELPDTIQDIAILLTLRPLKLPTGIKEPLNNLIDEVTKVCCQAADMVQEFDELVETSFGGQEA
ncbi:MAG: TIGR00153 family protein, partial [Planctomycetota bacterium]|nr:TIGR00153 family protein [Planctomycetota bacterium]